MAHYVIQGDSGEREVFVGLGRPLDEQGVLNAGLAIEQRAGFVARPGVWW